MLLDMILISFYLLEILDLKNNDDKYFISLIYDMIVSLSV